MERETKREGERGGRERERQRERDRAREIESETLVEGGKEEEPSVLFLFVFQLFK